MDDSKLSPLLRSVLDWLEPHVNNVKRSGEEAEDNDNQDSMGNDGAD